MGFLNTNSPTSTSRTTTQTSTINVTNGGLVLSSLGGKGTKLVAGDLITVGRGGTYNVTNTVDGSAPGGAQLADTLFGGGGGYSAASPPPSPPWVKWAIAAGAVLVMGALFMLRKR